MPRIDLWSPAFAEGGGIQTFSVDVARSLADYDLRLFARERTAWRRDHVTTPFSLRTGLSARFGLLVARKALAHHPSLIISAHLNFGPVALWLKRLQRIPYVLVAHGVDVHNQLSTARKTALRKADRIIAVSEHSRERLLAIGGIRDDIIRVLPNTVDDVRFTIGNRDPALLARYGIPVGRRIVITVGRLAASDAYKGYDTVIRGMPRILASVPDAHYVIVGKGDDRPRIEALISKHGLADRVTLTGFVADDELAAHYRMADAFAMPSTGEGFGIVFLEAMACGVPVLGGNRDGSVDALGNGELGLLVDPLSVNDVADGLIKLLSQQGSPLWFQPEMLRQKMLLRFGRPQFEHRLRAITSELLGRHESRPRSS